MATRDSCNAAAPPVVARCGLRPRLRAWLALLVLASPARAAHEDLVFEIAALTRRLASEPSSAWLYARRAELQRLRGDSPSAWYDVRTALRLDPELADARLVEARLLRDEGRTEAAAELLAELVREQPLVGPAHALHGEVLLAAGRAREAAAAWSRALETLGPSPDLYLARSSALASLGRASIDEALAGLDEGLARLGQVPGLVLAAVELERARGNTAGALARIRSAGPSLAPPLAARLEGDVLAAERPGEAALAYARALELVAELPPEKRRMDAIRALVSAVREALAGLPATR